MAASLCVQRCVSVRGCSGRQPWRQQICCQNAAASAVTSPSSYGGDCARVPVSVAGKGLALPFLGAAAGVKLTDRKDADLWCCGNLLCCQRSPSGRLIPAPSCHSYSLQLCSPLFSPVLYSFRPQPNNSVSGAGLSARAPTRHSLKQWHRADEIMEGGIALLSQ